MAASNRDLPRDIVVRPLRDGDLAAALALSREAGWNQVAADWRIFLDLGQAICLTRRDGPPIATAAALPYSGGFAWIGMVLVTAAERRQGLAQWLLRRLVADLSAQRLVPALDATPAGRTVYGTLGFQDGWTMQRLVAQAVRKPYTESPAPVVRALTAADWPQLLAQDAEVFGADRGALLQSFVRRLPEAALVADRGGRLAGYLLGRDGRVMNQLGPLVADDDAVARALLARAIAGAASPLAIDLPDRHTALGDWLAALGFAVERPFTRMIYGRSSGFGDDRRLFAIAGPELG